jgi:putative ABC transport system ATP-binding protein
MIELRNVTKTYGEGASRVDALLGIDLQITAGEFVSIMGPSGSGKSTLLHLISALDVPTHGEIRLNGVEIDKLDDDGLTLFRRHRIGLVFQFFNLLPTLDAFDNVLLPVLMERKASEADRKRAHELLDLVGLATRERHRLHQLSGGEMQRVAIARALMLQPRMILADEPTGNLDSKTGARILALLQQVRQQHETTIVMVTHDAAAAAAGDRLIKLRDGRIESDEPAGQAGDMLASAQ